MNDVKEVRTTPARSMGLREFAIWLEQSGSSPTEIAAELSELIWGQRSAMEELHAFAGFDLGAAIEALLRDIARSKPVGEDQVEHVETTRVALSSPAAPEPKTVAEAQTTAPQKDLDADPVTRAKRSTAISMLLVIDGSPLSEWSIGRCRTQARRKGQQAEMLRQVLQRCGHLPHTTEVGSVIGDDELRRIAASIV